MLAFKLLLIKKVQPEKGAFVFVMYNAHHV